MTINKLGRGDRIVYAGLNWTILFHDEGCVLLADEKVDSKPFNESEDKDFRKSTIREFLNDEFLKALPDNLVKMEFSLKAANGDTEYGSDEAKVGLLSLEQYRTYAIDSLESEIIKKTDGSWWLITPFSHNEPYIGAAYTQNVMLVQSDGSECGAPADSNLYGVRPLIKVKEDTDVRHASSVLDDEIETLLGKSISATDYIKELSDKCINIPKVQESLTDARAYAQNMSAADLFTDIVTLYNDHGSITGTISVRDLLPVLYEKTGGTL